MTEDTTKQVTFRIQRYDPESGSPPHFQEFVIPCSKGTTVLDGLMYIKENLDGTLAFRSSCRMSICGSCGMLINGYPHLACHTQIEEFHTDKLTVKPLPNLPIIKDLVPSLDSLFAKHKSIKPYLIHHDKQEMENPTAEFAQLSKELGGYLQFSYCVKCGICLAACPTQASDKLFLGPQAMAQCYRYCADSRDEGQKERISSVSADHGLWNCHLAGACSEACPKGVDPALAIQLLKKRLVSQTLGLGKKGPSPSIVSPSTETKPKVAAPAFNVKLDKKA